VGHFDDFLSIVRAKLKLPIMVSLSNQAHQTIVGVGSPFDKLRANGLQDLVKLTHYHLDPLLAPFFTPKTQTFLDSPPPYRVKWLRIKWIPAAYHRATGLVLFCFRYKPYKPEGDRMVRIRMQRVGRPHQPHFRIVAIHGTKARDAASLEVIGHYQKVLEITPGSAAIHNELGIALASAGKADEAIAHFEQALEIDTAFTEARFNLGATFQYLKKDTPAALVQWRQVLEAEPNNVLVLYETVLILATSAETSVRNGAEAVVLAERAAELSGRREAVILDTLAAAYAEAGRFPEAVKTARLALGLAIEARQQPLAEALRTRIALYGAARPLRFTEPQASSLPQP